MRGTGRSPVVKTIRVRQTMSQSMRYAKPAESFQLRQDNYHLPWGNN